VKAFADFEAVPSTVLFAGTKLRRQTQGVGLLFVLTRTQITAPTICGSLAPTSDAGKVRRLATMAKTSSSDIVSVASPSSSRRRAIEIGSTSSFT
jgi:hypothetical protein